MKQATQEDKSKILSEAKLIVDESPESVKSELNSTVMAIIEERSLLAAGEAPYQMIQFMIPADPIRVPSVLEAGVKGMDEESLRSPSYIRLGQHVLDYPHLIKLESDDKNKKESIK